MVSGTMQGEILSACERAWAWLELPAEDCARRIEDTIHSDVAARWQLQALPFVRHRLMHEAGIHPNDNAPRAALSDSVATGQASAAELELSRHLNATLAIDRLVTERFPDAVLPPASSDGQREALLARTPALTEAMHACDVARATPQGLARLQAAIAVFDAAGSQAQGRHRARAGLVAGPGLVGRRARGTGAGAAGRRPPCLRTRRGALHPGCGRTGGQRLP